MSTPIFFTADLLSYIDDVLCHSVIKNVAHLCGRSRSKMWGSEGWKKIVVCFASDGRNNVNKRALQVLSSVRPKNSTRYATKYIVHLSYLIGCYQDAIAKDSVGQENSTARIFECDFGLFFWSSNFI